MTFNETFQPEKNMAYQYVQQLSFHRLSALFLLIYATSGAAQIFRQEPGDVSVIIGSQVYLLCRVNEAVLQQLPTKSVTWFVIKGSEAEEIQHGQENRFFISATNGIFDLRIDYTTASDQGTSYICSFNDTASRTASLTVLPESWKPTCLIVPTTEVKAGDTIQITCTSDGDLRTQLLWQKNNVILEGAERSTTGNAVKLMYSETATNGESPELEYTCIATIMTIVGMVHSEVCTAGPIQVTGKPSNSGAYIPYIIVGLLSVVVSMLFLTLLVVLFRHRRCRMCVREPPPPQTVVDMDALRNGPPLFYPIHDSSDDGADDGIGRSPPPDVIPTVAAPVIDNKRKPKSKSVVDRSSQARRPQQQRQQRQQPQGRGGHGVSGSQSTRERGPLQRQDIASGPSRNKSNPYQPNQLEVPTGAPLKRTSSNTTLQGNIDDREKDKTVTGKKKLTMTNYMKASGSKQRKATSLKQPSKSTSKQQQQRRGGGRGGKSNRQSAYQVKTGVKKQDDDAKSLKQLNINTIATTASSSSSSSQQVRPGPSGISAADTSIDTNDISLEIPIDDPTSSSLNDLGDTTLSGRDSELRRSGRQSLYNKNVGARPVSQELNDSEVAAGASSSSSFTGGASQDMNSDKVVYAALDFQKSIGLNILPDV